MAKDAAIQEAEVAPLQLKTADGDAYCRSLLATRGAEMWWFQTGAAPYRGYSRPFQDHDGRWWWRPKPQFAWTLDYFQPLQRPPRMPFGQAMLGRQYPAPAEVADSRVHFNVIHELAGYDLSCVASQKRRAVRKGLRGVRIEPLDPRDPASAEEARIVWNSHVERTGWNATFDERQFAAHWRPLADRAGVNVFGARDATTGVLCAWVVSPIVAGVVYVDTIASHSDRLENRPNDTLIFLLLYSAGRIQGVRHANYFLRSSLAPLEQFKQSLGFESSGIPSRLCVNPLVAAALRRLKPAAWQRLKGDPPEKIATTSPNAAPPE